MPVAGLTTLGIVLLCSMFGGCVTSGGEAVPTAEGVDRVRAGEPTFLQQTYMTMDKSCRQVKRPTAVLTRDPEHGKVRMATRKAEAVYGPGPYAHCDGRVGNSLAFEYTSRPDYRGRDSFEVKVRYADGEVRHGRFEIEVR
ncbi:MAG: hypothetical protein J0J10_08715 [Bosea sp.]|uniref:hypothetical protein n=1 Tax=Bosea sp. (in: a-proteobacteria) TaxID=1871050 RepID=UPI001AD41F80|nr:hypothetical protein [Bosea sp. (in: a-proteobacteria)]MBN9468839.1 hypothetical protein [Bosea sp. (in: a-proteobacteria)]